MHQKRKLLQKPGTEFTWVTGAEVQVLSAHPHLVLINILETVPCV